MATNRKEGDDPAPSAAHGGLSRLLETEALLDAMLQNTKREAAELVESARAEAEDRIRRAEMEIETADLALRDHVARERDEAVTAIRADAAREADELDALDDQRIEDLARYVVKRVAGHGSGGRS